MLHFDTSNAGFGAEGANSNENPVDEAAEAWGISFGVGGGEKMKPGALGAGTGADTRAAAGAKEKSEPPGTDESFVLGVGSSLVPGTGVMLVVSEEATGATSLGGGSSFAEGTTV